jgi:hypothetical protein
MQCLSSTLHFFNGCKPIKSLIPVRFVTLTLDELSYHNLLHNAQCLSRQHTPREEKNAEYFWFSFSHEWLVAREWKFNPLLDINQLRRMTNIDYPNNIWWRVKFMKLLIMQFLQSPITSSLLGPNILQSTMFPKTLNLCSPLYMRDQVSHPYNTAGKISSA